MKTLVPKLVVVCVLLLVVISNVSAQGMTWNSVDGLVATIIEAFMPALTVDDDEILEFYWTPSPGAVTYNIFLFDNGQPYATSFTTSTLPTAAAPYPVPIVAQWGHIYRLQVQGVDAAGVASVVSEPSDPVLCMAQAATKTKPLAVVTP